MNKILKSTVLCALLFCGSIFPQIKLLDQEVIDKKAAAIESTMTREKYVLVAFTAMGIAQNVVYLAPIYFWLVGKKDPNEDTIAIIQENIQKEVNPVVKLSWAEIFTNFGQATKDLFCTQDGWLSIAKNGFYVGGQLSICLILKKIIDDLQHPNTITWYVSAKVPYKKITRVMSELVQRVHTRSLSVDQSDFYHLSLKNSCNQLANCGEGICAYMQYKSNSSALSQSQRSMAYASSRYLFNYHNTWIKEVSALLESEKQQYSKVEQLVISYELELAHQIKLFSSLESEIAL